MLKLIINKVHKRGLAQNRTETVKNTIFYFVDFYITHYNYTSWSIHPNNTSIDKSYISSLKTNESPLQLVKNEKKILEFFTTQHTIDWFLFYNLFITKSTNYSIAHVNGVPPICVLHRSVSIEAIRWCQKYSKGNKVRKSLTAQQHC